MMLQYFKDFESGIAARLAEDPQSPNPRKKYALAIARLGSRLYSGKHRNKGTSVKYGHLARSLLQ